MIRQMRKGERRLLPILYAREVDPINAVNLA
jgi:hypothetical protein